MAQEDPVRAIKLLDDIAKLLLEFKDSSMGLSDEDGEHPVKHVGMVLLGCRDVMFQRYGKMLWESADGPIDKSLSKEDISNLSEKVLPDIRTKAPAKDKGEATEDGQPVQ